LGLLPSDAVCHLEVGTLLERFFSNDGFYFFLVAVFERL
jgi:hypothetical protein